MQRVVVWDTNVYRSGFGSQGKPLTEDAFTALLQSEERRGVQPYADPWVAFELLAHLADPNDPNYTACRSALRRYYVRCLSGRKGSGGLSDSESQVTKLITGKVLEGHAQFTTQLAYLCAEVGRTPPDQPLSLSKKEISFIAKHVKVAEERFANTCRVARSRVDSLTASQDQAVRGAARAAGKKVVESQAMRVVFAESIVRGALKNVGLPVPEALDPRLVDLVQKSFAVGIEFLAIILGKVAFDGANIDKSRNRNLIWDERISYSIGQKIGDAPIWFVTDDGDFHAAAAQTSYRARVRWPADYEAWLSEKSDGLGRSRR